MERFFCLFNWCRAEKNDAVSVPVSEPSEIFFTVPDLISSFGLVCKNQERK
jgi:hypothetical protein